MTITAKCILATRSDPYGPTITTLQLRYPRFIHSELMTHRVFSRSASSSRAVPVSKIIQQVIDDPAMPVHWGANRPGMQATEEVDDPEVAREVWLEAASDAVRSAKRLVFVGAHKQVVNRILEPFAHIDVVVTSTEWDNFFMLRDDDAADPTMRQLAIAMRQALESAVVNESNYHLPYVRLRELTDVEGLMLSAARCARVSYQNHDGTDPDPMKDLELVDKLLSMKHLSPFEHQAVALDPEDPAALPRSNFHPAWTQFRKIIEAHP